MTIRGLFIIAGLALLFVFCVAGCGPQIVEVRHTGGYKVDVNHGEQKMTINKGWRRNRDRP